MMMMMNSLAVIDTSARIWEHRDRPFKHLEFGETLEDTRSRLKSSLAGTYNKTSFEFQNDAELRYLPLKMRNFDF